MKKTMLGKTNLEIPVIAVGCMRIAEMETDRLTEHIRFCIEHGLISSTMQIFTEEDNVNQDLRKHLRKQDIKERM